MDKNAIKKFAVWAREELIKRVSQRAMKYGFEEGKAFDLDADSANGKVLTPAEKEQRRALAEKIKSEGYSQVMEEVAYTWFNRFVALRFMEVNNYLPTRVRVFTNAENKLDPQILEEALHLELDGLDMEKVYQYKNNNDKEGLYKYLLITQCYALHEILPIMFPRKNQADYTMLLMPDNLLREGSVIEQMISLLPEDNWKDAVDVIGWSYQYYISQRHDEIVNIYKGTVKQEDIPAATQLFTTDWVVRYMVDNSLGRYWIERHPESNLAEKLEFLVNPKDGKIQTINESVTPQDLTFFDPCMGSGHILAYAFDVLMEIYREYGYTDREAVSEIIQNNLHGFDIDERCTQLAYFVMMMKARQYDARFFKRKVYPQVYYPKADSDLKAYGSLLQIDTLDTKPEEPEEITLFDMDYDIKQNDWNCRRLLSKKYAVVCTNPPYLNKYNNNLKKFVTENYKDYSGDLFSVFIYRNFGFCKKEGYSAFMTPFVWMFIKTYEKLREYIINSKSITSLIQMEYSAFEEATVPICSFVLQNCRSENRSLCFRLSDFKGGMEVQKRKVLEAIQNPNCGYFYEAQQSNFSKIPGSPVAYWVSEATILAYKSKTLDNYMNCKSGIMTGSDTYIKLWHEPSITEIKFNCQAATDMGEYRWFPLNSGGDFRKWYGNNQKVVNLWHDGADIKANVKNYRLRDPQYYFRRGITWGRITSSQIAFREVIDGSLFGDAGPIGFIEQKRNYVLGFLCSKIVTAMLQITNPTLNFQVRDIMNLPLALDDNYLSEVEDMVRDNIKISKDDWDSFETSWDFESHPMFLWSKNLWDATAIGAAMQCYYGSYPKAGCPLELCYLLWKGQANQQFLELKSNEEELNRIFIGIYGLQDELDPVVADKDVTVHYLADTKDDIPESMQGSNYVLTRRDAVVSLLSYAVGCMFGRYSLDVDGLAYAGGEWDAGKYTTYPADKDNIIPICDDEYFDDDIVGRFVKFIETVYGKDTLEENLKFIADALGGKGQPKEVIRNYFMNDFYADHCKIYQKRPIYWLFDSGKKNGFKALIYMHRYQPDTIARLRTDYVHEQQSRYRTAIADMENRIANAAAGERVKLNKTLTKLKDQDAELRSYEEKVHHLADQMIAIDLDDGVKVNYAKFQDVLAKIK